MAAQAGIIAQLEDRFQAAHASGDLFFFPSTVHRHEEAGINWEIRLCPALQKKPDLPVPHFDAGVGIEKIKPDPFTPPYTPSLLVGELRDDEENEDYVVLLNKFSVVPQHFLLVPKDYKSQASPLFPSELVQAYLLLDAARKVGRNIFAFYNCGERSGASQHHKHIQFIPADEGPPIEQLARGVKLEADDKAFTISALPFANHIRRLPSHLASKPREELEPFLGMAFMMLLDLAISTARHSPDHPIGSPSYNVVITLEHMYVFPRRQESHVLTQTGDLLSVNALGFAGMLLVKSERELEAVKSEGIPKILKSVALDSVHEVQISEPHETDGHAA